MICQDDLPGVLLRGFSSPPGGVGVCWRDGSSEEVTVAVVS